MRRILAGLFVMLGFLLLSGCAGAYKTLNSVSTKHDGSLINTEQPAASGSAQKCDQWCHNGWCSTHCASADQ